MGMWPGAFRRRRPRSGAARKYERKLCVCRYPAVIMQCSTKRRTERSAGRS